MAVETWLEELGEPVCRRLLAGAAIGRLAVVVDGRPQIFPVNHVVDEVSGDVVFPSNARTKLHGALDEPGIAFEVDGFDQGGRSAWSVVVTGRVEDVTGTELAERAAARRVLMWAVGAYTHWVRIEAERITGRRISALPEA